MGEIPDPRHLQGQSRLRLGCRPRLSSRRSAFARMQGWRHRQVSDRSGDPQSARSTSEPARRPRLARRGFGNPPARGRLTSSSPGASSSLAWTKDALASQSASHRRRRSAEQRLATPDLAADAKPEPRALAGGGPRGQTELWRADTRRRYRAQARAPSTATAALCVHAANAAQRHPLPTHVARQDDAARSGVAESGSFRDPRPRHVSLRWMRRKRRRPVSHG